MAGGDRRVTAVDWFAVELVLDGHRMNLTGADRDAAVLALADRGHTYTEIGDRVRLSRAAARKAVDAARQRAQRAQPAPVRRTTAA